MLNYAVPIIEQLASGQIGHLSQTVKIQTYERRHIAARIKKYLRTNDNGSVTYRQDYYCALCDLLRRSDSRRILLYIPLNDLTNAPQYFRDVYLDAWYSLLNVQDTRENFFEGDTYEVDARPNGQLERVVKCAHLTPWLIEAGYLSYDDLYNILLAAPQDEVLLRSFANTWRMIDDKQLLQKAELSTLKDLTAGITQREHIQPLYVSEKRHEWLKKRTKHTNQLKLMTPDAQLAGPFSPNIESLGDELNSIQSLLATNEIVLVGGSQLKGYGVKDDSDLDTFKLAPLQNHAVMYVGSPHAAHIYFNAIWIGGSAVHNLSDLSLNIAETYFGSNERKMSLERIESDLLQYRLLHKGFQRFFGSFSSVAKNYPEIDGDCPFFDDSYRRIATELFAKYVFIPA